MTGTGIEGERISEDVMNTTRLALGLVCAIALQNLAAAQVSIQPPPDLVAWWPGDGNTDDIAGGQDAVLNNGATFAAGKVGQGFLFDGSNDHVHAPDSPGSGLDGVNQFTIDAWVRSDNISGFRSVVTKYNTTSQNPATSVQSYSLGVQNGAIEIVFYSGFFDLVGAKTEVVINQGQFHHIAATLDSGVVNVYVDGVEVPFTPLAGGTFTGIHDNDEPVRIGATSSGTGVSQGFPGGISFFWHGIIDEVELFDRALSATEILAIFNAEAAGKSKDLCPPAGAPHARAGTSLSAGDQLQLDAACSTDVNGDPLEFGWLVLDALQNPVILLPIAPGQETVDISTLPSGNYTIYLDATDGINTSTDKMPLGIKQGGALPGEAYPDLIISNITFGGGPSNNLVTVEVANVGSLGASDVVVKLSFATTTMTKIIANLAVGSPQSVQFSTAPAGVGAGTTVTACADPANNITEVSETNNCLSATAPP